MPRTPRNRALQSAARALASAEGISYQAALSRLSPAPAAQPVLSASGRALLSFYEPAGGCTEPRAALERLGVPHSDEPPAWALQHELARRGLARADEDPRREVEELLVHLRALLDERWLLALADITPDRRNPLSEQLEWAVGNYRFVDCPAPFGLSSIEAHRLRAFMENETVRFRQITRALFDLEPAHL